MIPVDARTLAGTGGQGVGDRSRNLHARGLVDPVRVDQLPAGPVAAVEEQQAEPRQIIGRDLDAARPIQHPAGLVQLPRQVRDADRVEDPSLQIIVQRLAGNLRQGVSVVLRGFVPVHVFVPGGKNGGRGSTRAFRSPRRWSSKS